MTKYMVQDHLKLLLKEEFKKQLKKFVYLIENNISDMIRKGSIKIEA